MKNPDIKKLDYSVATVVGVLCCCKPVEIVHVFREREREAGGGIEAQGVPVMSDYPPVLSACCVTQ